MRSTLTIVVALLTSTTAGAGWEYTNWGMTYDQVIKASKGFIPADTKPTPSKIGSEMKGVLPFFPADVKFEFGAKGGLRRVYVKPAGSMTCQQMLTGLIGAHWKPIEGDKGLDDRYSALRWRAKDIESFVTMWRSSDGCSVTYERLGGDLE